MNIEAAHLICYSPTRTTFTTLEAIADGMKLPATRSLDLTLPAQAPNDEIVILSDVAIIGVPVYAGRVAPVAAKRLKSIKGNNTPAVIVVVYGNRHYDDALMELKKLAEGSGFVIVAAAAFIGEHSYSSPEKPVAAGRPDGEDKHAARQFGAQVKTKLNAARDLSGLPPLDLPGTLPEGPYMGPSNIAPETDPELCTLCGQCAECCPTGAITVSEAITTDASLCTFCCACLKTCPEDAIRIGFPKVLEKVDLLYTHCQARREPELFL
ncbi:(Fe-S)-binding protein [Desulfoluna limicola]|uniref:(Fe-S)-binding protein n=1 Tax=Desulfoluna limicola TaxID=2810562 RepID=A0ABM7PIY4_9BACT|nr:4Fe-4S binding protein [Desulfoluna limicola]BCS97517.1 (Fe-S)-binding protein [Desulfoluna limicola]